MGDVVSNAQTMACWCCVLLDPVVVARIFSILERELRSHSTTNYNHPRASGSSCCRTVSISSLVTWVFCVVSGLSRRPSYFWSEDRGPGWRLSLRTWWPPGCRKIIPVWRAHLCIVCSLATMPQDLPWSEVTSWKCGLLATRVGEASHSGLTDILGGSSVPPRDPLFTPRL